MPNNNYALSLLSEAPYLSIANPTVRTAIATIAGQLPLYRFQGTAVAAANALRDLIADVVSGQQGQTYQVITVPAEGAELLSDRRDHAGCAHRRSRVLRWLGHSPHSAKRRAAEPAELRDSLSADH